MPITKKMLKAKDGASRKAKVAYLVRVEGPRDQITGKRKRYSKQVATMKEAQSLEKTWEAEIERGTAIDPAKTTVAELLDSWLQTKVGTITENSAKDYEIAIRLHLKPALGNVHVQKLSAPQVQAALELWRERGMSDRMIHRCHLVLSQALKQAMQWGVVQRNACDAVKKPKLSRGKPTVWTPAEAARFLDSSRDDGLWPLWPLLILRGCDGVKPSGSAGPI